MKKFWRLLLCFVLVLSLILCFGACDSGSSRDDDEDEDEEDIYGRYYFVYAEYDGEIMDGEGTEWDGAYIDYDEDGEATACSGEGKETDLEWDDDEMWVEDEEDEVLEYKIKKGCLYVYNNDGMTAVFAMKGVDVDIPDADDEDEDEDDRKDSEDGEDEEAKEVSTDYYYFAYMESDGEAYTYEDIGEDYGDSFLMLYSDGTGYMYIMGEGAEMGWNDDEIWPEEDEDEVVELDISKGIATIITEDYSMVFTEWGIEVDVPGGSSNRETDDDISGYYVFSYAEYGGEKLTADDVGVESDDMYLYIYSDGTGYWYAEEEGLDMVWEDGMIWPEGEEADAVEFEVDGDYLYMSADGLTVVFERN